MSLLLVQTGDIKVFDGWIERCRLHAAEVHFNFNNQAEEFSLTTDNVGLLPDTGNIVNAKHTTVRVTVLKQGYKTVSVRGKVTWVGDLGSIGIESIYMGAK